MLSRYGTVARTIAMLMVTIALHAADGISPADASTPGEPGGQAYYVSTTGYDGGCTGYGTQSNPWATITFAATCISPGDTVHVAPGIYNGFIDIEVSGTANARIRFVSDMQWGAQLRSSSGSDLTTVEVGSYGSDNRGTANYVDFEGFDVSGVPPNGIIAYGSHIRLIGNRVHDITVPCNGNGGSGLNFQNIYADGYNEAISNLVHDVKLADPQGCGATHGSGIYFLNPHGVAYNNISYNNGQTGIQVSHNANVETISNNLIFNNGNAGIWLDCADGGCVFNDYDTVGNNMVFNNSTLATECGITINNTSSMGTHNLVVNNIVYGNRGGDLCLHNKGTQVGTETINPANGTLFVRWSDTGGGDYHLTSTSPAVNAGSTRCSAETSWCVPPIDFEGGLRPAGAVLRWDIGPYEYGARLETWPWY